MDWGKTGEIVQSAADNLCPSFLGCCTRSLATALKLLEINSSWGILNSTYSVYVLLILPFALRHSWQMSSFNVNIKCNARCTLFSGQLAGNLPIYSKPRRWWELFHFLIQLEYKRGRRFSLVPVHWQPTKARTGLALPECNLWLGGCSPPNTVLRSAQTIVHFADTWIPQAVWMKCICVSWLEALGHSE